MYKRIGFAWTTDTIAIATLVFGVVYFFVASGATAFKSLVNTPKSDDVDEAEPEFKVLSN